MFEPPWRLQGGFLSGKAVAELSSDSGAAEDSLPARTKPRSPAQLRGRSRSLGAGTAPWITRVVPGSVFPRDDAQRRAQRRAQSAVYMSQRGASALSAFSPVTQPIYWHRISLLSKLKLLKQTNANVILAVTAFLGMGHNKHWFSHRSQTKTFTDFLSSDAVLNLAL